MGNSRLRKTLARYHYWSKGGSAISTRIMMADEGHCSSSCHGDTSCSGDGDCG